MSKPTVEQLTYIRDRMEEADTALSDVWGVGALNRDPAAEIKAMRAAIQSWIDDLTTQIEERTTDV